MVEGEGASAKVVTASPPFSGYSDSYGNIAAIGDTLGGGVGGFVLNSLADQNFMMQWTFSQPLIGVASQDIVVGKVLRTIPPGPGQTNPTFAPIAGALITRTDDTAQHNFALSGKDGLFSMFTTRLGAATIPITITLQTGEKQQLDAIVENTAQPDDSNYSLQPDTYRLYKNVARVTVTFGPVAPTPAAPQMDIRIFSLDASNKRTEISGLVPAGTRLAIGVASTKDPSLDIRSLSVNGQPVPFGPDSGVPKLIVSTSADFVPTQAGIYTVSALALSPLGGPPVTASKDFRVLASGETNSTIDQNTAPTVVSVVPVNHAQRVSPNVFPQVVFSEPVTRVPGNITLKDDQGTSVDFTLLAVGRTDALGNTPVFDNLQDSSAAVTAVTLQPKNSLKYATTYTLTVNQAIRDLDASPKPLANVFTSQFTTMGPQLLATPTDVFSSPRVVILNDNAYIGRLLGDNGSLEAYSTENPGFLGSPIGTVGIQGPPTDLAGEVDNSPNGIGRPYVAVATGLSAFIRPSNVWIYDASDPTNLTALGVVGMSGDAAQQGVTLRLTVKDGVAYASTFLKGIQTFNVSEVVNAYQEDKQEGNDRTAIFLVENGNGGYHNELVHTIPVTRPVSDGHGGTVDSPVSLTGLGVADYVLPNQRLTRLVVASGLFGLTVVDPVQQSVLLPIQPIPGTVSVPGRLDSGFALALATISDVPIAAVVGQGNGYNPGTNTYIDGPVLAVLNMTNPALPQPISFMALPGNATDILISKTTAFVSLTGSIGAGAILIDLTDLAHPYISGGLIPGLAGRLALQNGSILYSTGIGPINGGIHSALVFGSACDVFRNKKNPPAAASGTWSRDKHLEWSLNYSWRSDSHQTWQANDGLVLSNVQLGRRKMANEMSLPYFTLQRTDPATGATSSARCELIAGQALPYVGDGTTPRNTPSACDALPQSRSMLVDFQDVQSDGNKAALEATYLIDHLDGDPQKTPEVPDSCVVVKQRYEFYKEGLVPFEPFGKFPSAKFRPLVDYQYFTDSNGPTLKALTAAQRLDFDARNANAPASKAAVNDTMLSCDVDSKFPTLVGADLIITTDCLPSLGNLSLVGMYRDENPLAVEQLLPVIAGGARNHIPNVGGILPGNTTIDNFHQNPTPAGDPDHEIDEPSASQFGCPACVHIHWRWSNTLFPGSHLPFLGTIDPDFDNHQGNLILPPGTNQDVTIGILQSGGLGEKHPSTVEGLFFPPLPRPISPSSLIGQSIQNVDNAQIHPVFWYIATGHKNSEEFFFHGGGFGTFYLNQINIPAPQGLQTTPMSFNIEHSRQVNYTIKVVRDVFVDHGTIPFETTFSGTLPADQDDIKNDVPSNSAWTFDTVAAHITVTLTDTTLHKTTWEKTYDISGPTQPGKPFEP
jgi:hypothetical protein